MKKLIKFLVLLGGIAVAVWYFRNELAPTPQSAKGPAPHFRTPEPRGQAPTTAPPAPAISEPEQADDLTAVKGIGPVYAGKLADEGVTTFSQLAAADPARIAEALDVSPQQVTDWSDQAKRLA